MRRDFTAGRRRGQELARNCGIGCTCGATIYKTEGPSQRPAEHKTMCFNDTTGEGISRTARHRTGCPQRPASPPTKCRPSWCSTPDLTHRGTPRRPPPPRPQPRQAQGRRAEIEAILKNDIAGPCGPRASGWAEVFWNLWPSYSILRGDFPAIRITSVAGDYANDHARMASDRANTAQMVTSIGVALAQCGMQWLELDNVLTRSWAPPTSTWATCQNRAG